MTSEMSAFAVIHSEKTGGLLRPIQSRQAIAWHLRYRLMKLLTSYSGWCLCSTWCRPLLSHLCWEQAYAMMLFITAKKFAVVLWLIYIMDWELSSWSMKDLFLFLQTRLLQASCLPPYGPAFGCSKLFPIILPSLSLRMTNL